MHNIPEYVDYTSPIVLDAVRKHGLNKLATRCLQLSGSPIETITEKTAGELLNSAMSVHLATKKYLDHTRDSVQRITGDQLWK